MSWAVPDAELSRLELQPDLSAPGDARTWAEAVLAGTPFEGHAVDVVLVVAELVTNAVLHAAPPLHVVLRAVDAGVRVEVGDGRTDRVPSTAGSGLVELLALDDEDEGPHYSGITALDTETMTGRGLVLVSALADDWGVEVHDAGKVVWADVGTGHGSTADEAPPAPERRSAADESAAGVRLVGVPVRLVLTSAANLDDLVREVRLVDPAPESAELAMQVVGEPLRTAARDAVERRERLLDMTVDVPRSAGSALREFLDVVGRIVELCRTGVLLSLEPSEEIAAFRRWYVDEVVSQLAGNGPVPCPFPVVPPDDAAVLAAAAEAASHVGSLAPRPAPHPTWLDEAEAALAGATDLAGIIAAAVAAASQLGARNGSLCLLAGDGVTVELTQDLGYGDDVRGTWSTFSVADDLPASEVIRTGEPMFLRTAAERDVRFPIFRSTPVVGDEALAILPLRRGALVLGFEHRRAFDRSDRAVLGELGRLVDRAADRSGRGDV